MQILHLLLNPAFKPKPISFHRQFLPAFFLFLVLRLIVYGQTQAPDIASDLANDKDSFTPGPAPPGSITIQAQQQQKTGPHDFFAKGQVEIHYQDMLLRADEVRGNDETGQIGGEGNIYFEQAQQKVHGKRFTFNLQTKTGIFYEVKGRADPGFIFEAEEVEKLGEFRYRVKKGVVTACEDKVPKWSFSVTEGVLQVDQHINMRNALFRIKKVPLFFSPYFFVPTTDTSRQSGFLIPSTGNSSTKGRSFRDSFYLTLGRSADLLTTAEYFSERGVAGGMEFRARPSEHSQIFAQGFVAVDRQGQGGQSARVIADTQFENGFRAVANVDVVSSQTFRQIYGDSFNTIFRPDEVSSGFLSRNFSSYSVNIFGERRTTNYSPQAVTTRTFPSFDLFGNSRQIKDWPIYFSFDADVDGLSRTDHQISTPPMVQRFDLYPRLTIPLLRHGGWSFTPTVAVRETYYSSRLDSSSPAGVSSQDLVRSAAEFEGKLSAPSVARVFMFRGKRYKHAITPEISYRYIFGIDETRETIRFDDRDIMSDTNQVEYYLTNRFFSRYTTSDGGTATREFLSWRIGQAYFFDPDFGGALVPGRRNVFYPLDTLTAFAFVDRYRKYSPLFSRLRFTPAQRYAADFRMDYDPMLHRLRTSSVAGSVYVANNFVALTYYNTRNLPPNQSPSNQIRVTVGYGNFTRRGINAAWSFNYDFNSKTRQYSIAQLAYNWDCCGVSLELRQVGLRQFDPNFQNESQYRFTFSLKNVGSFGNLRRQERLF